MLSALRNISQFLQLLQQREQTVSAVDTDAGEKQPTLIFANALLRNALQRSANWHLPPQLVVMGPTQSGKSSVVNLLLGKLVAEASPLAGHTRFAHGFTGTRLTSEAELCLESVLPDWQRVDSVSSGEGKLYSVVHASLESSFTQRDILVWDTPDFDSVGSRNYRDTVPEICALADAVLLVVSREKYADRSVWRLLRLVSPLGIPLMICLNKTVQREQAALLASLESRLQLESIAPAGIICLPYVERAEEELADTSAAAELRNRVDDFLQASVTERSGQLLISYLDRHWRQWTVPLRRELAAVDHWRQEVEAGIEEAVAGYQSECLNKPHYSYALQLAILRLLELLEIPGIAATLTKVRSVLTWPARRLQTLFKKHFPGKDAGGKEQEAEILKELVTHLLISLQHKAGEQLHAVEDSTFGWWRELLSLITNERAQLMVLAEAAVAEYQSGFDEEIEAASQRLYHHLQQHPATLNGLRAARVGTDTAAIVLVLKTGGVGINDLILTPAMLSLTSLLAEGAVGGYMKQVEAELKERQLALLQQTLFQDLLEKRLLSLPESIAREHRYAISSERLEQAEQLLKSLTK